MPTCVCLCVHGHVSAVPPEAKRGHWVPGSGLKSGCVPPDMGARNPTQVLCESTYSQPLSHLSSSSNNRVITMTKMNGNF